MNYPNCLDSLLHVVGLPVELVVVVLVVLAVVVVVVVAVLLAERSEASNPGRTTEMGVVLYGSPSSYWYIYIYIYIYIYTCVCVCVCVYKSKISPPHDHVS